MQDQKDVPKDIAMRGLLAVLLFIISIIVGLLVSNLDSFALELISNLLWFFSILFFAVTVIKLGELWHKKQLKFLGYIFIISAVLFGVTETVLDELHEQKYSNIYQMPESEIDPKSPEFLEYAKDVIIMLLLVFVNILVLSVIAYFIYKTIGEVSGIDEFKTAGFIFLISALTLIFLIGIIGFGLGLMLSLYAWGKALYQAVENEKESNLHT
ncbi:MAG: hypothetical protein GXO48_06990 [Chlorobi bacterium]|nr:hypothetical protein [Chlorobiota bacterium]